MAYATLEPFTWDADYLGHAITSATVANVNRGKDQRPYRVEEFMPNFEKQNQSPDQMKQIAAMWTAIQEGEDG
jgi:hypothetical protein